MWLIKLLQVVFLILKICGVIDWSWWIVFIPSYVGVVLYLPIAVFKLVIKIKYKIIKRLFK